MTVTKIFLVLILFLSAGCIRITTTAIPNDNHPSNIEMGEDFTVFNSSILKIGEMEGKVEPHTEASKKEEQHHAGHGHQHGTGGHH